MYTFTWVSIARVGLPSFPKAEVVGRRVARCAPAAPMSWWCGQMAALLPTGRAGDLQPGRRPFEVNRRTFNFVGSLLGFLEKG